MYHTDMASIPWNRIAIIYFFLWANSNFARKGICVIWYNIDLIYAHYRRGLSNTSSNNNYLAVPNAEAD